MEMFGVESGIVSPQRGKHENQACGLRGLAVAFDCGGTTRIRLSALTRTFRFIEIIDI
jgi:hypothetical protein